jgi:pimeloyl-ACP methyl ester carboxylesterase
VIWGEEDAWLAPESGRRLVEAIPATRLTTIPNAGHFVPEDRPDDVPAPRSVLLVSLMDLGRARAGRVRSSGRR